MKHELPVGSVNAPDNAGFQEPKLEDFMRTEPSVPGGVLITGAGTPKPHLLLEQKYRSMLPFEAQLEDARINGDEVAMHELSRIVQNRLEQRNK